MTRRKGIFKILSVVLAVLLLAVGFAGCGEYTPPESSGGSLPVTPTPDDPTPTPDDPDDDRFTVSLVLRSNDVETPFTNSDYALITELQAQWTEITDGRAEVYSAPFDKNGVAKAPDGLDGDFNVTLKLTEKFKKLYTYDPNPARPERRDELVATNFKKEVTVPLYKLKTLGSVGTISFLSGGSASYYVLNETGAYSYTFNSKTDSQMFAYSPKISGEYSFMTLMDVTADEVNPKLDMYNGQVGNFLFPAGDAENLGGAEGNYTKNIWLKYQLSEDMTGGGNCMAFKLYSESEKSDAYPITIYFIFERDGEYTRPITEATVVPVTEDFKNRPAKPDGEFGYIGDYVLILNLETNEYEFKKENERHILNQKNVKYNDPAKGGDGYYYYINPATGDFFKDANDKVDAQYRVYAKITQPNKVHDEFTYEQLFVALRQVCEKEGLPVYDYQKFIEEYASYCNDDGAYPVNGELKTFLQRYAVAQRLFNDGNGYAEPGINSDEDSQWLYACGIYVE